MSLLDEVEAFEQKVSKCAVCTWVDAQPDYAEWVDILATHKETSVLLKVAKAHGATFSYPTLARHRKGHA